jgi:hypothetical protein
MTYRRALLVGAGIALSAGVAFGAAESRRALRVGEWRVVQRKSGPVNYYTIFNKAAPPYIRGEYRPPLETVVLGYQLPDAEREHAAKLRWSWRAVKLPKDGNECAEGKGDSAAVVYVTWKRGLRWYVLKYVWSAVGRKGAVCARKRNPFVAQDTIILQTGGPLNVWKSEAIDLKAEFRKHFEGGDPTADVPDFVGLGLMTDGDDTESHSVADYADFSITR